MLSKHEARLLGDVFKGLLSKVGGATENPVRKILRKQASKPRRIFSKDSDFATKFKMSSSYHNPTDYGRPRTFMGG